MASLSTQKQLEEALARKKARDEKESKSQQGKFKRSVQGARVTQTDNDGLPEVIEPADSPAPDSQTFGENPQGIKSDVTSTDLVSQGDNLPLTKAARQGAIRLENSPFGLFEQSEIEARTATGLDMLTRSWSRMADETLSFDTPEEYANLVNHMHSTWSRMKVRADARVIFAMGKILMNCQSRFLNDKDAQGWSQYLNFDDFLARKLQVERRTAYRFMRVAREVPSALEDKDFNFAQLLEIATLKQKGHDLEQLPENAAELPAAKLRGLLLSAPDNRGREAESEDEAWSSKSFESDLLMQVGKVLRHSPEMHRLIRTIQGATSEMKIVTDKKTKKCVEELRLVLLAVTDALGRLEIN